MRLASSSGRPPSEFAAWSARDLARVEHVDVRHGLFDRQVVALLGSVFASLAEQDPAQFVRSFFTEE